MSLEAFRSRAAWDAASASRYGSPRAANLALMGALYVVLGLVLGLVLSITGSSSAGAGWTFAVVGLCMVGAVEIVGFRRRSARP